jgi:hypothetical protein
LRLRLDKAQVDRLLAASALKLQNRIRRLVKNLPMQNHVA